MVRILAGPPSLKNSLRYSIWTMGSESHGMRHSWCRCSQGSTCRTPILTSPPGADRKLKPQGKREAWQSLEHSPVPGYWNAVPRPGPMIATGPSTRSYSVTAGLNQMFDIAYQ